MVVDLERCMCANIVTYLHAYHTQCFLIYIIHNAKDTCDNPLINIISAIFIEFSTFVYKVLDVLCSLCVGNDVAVRSNQNLICDNLLPGRDLLLQTRVVEHVFR
jgi:hypothetical protein